MEKMKYLGCFFDPQQLQEALKAYPRQILHREIEHPHITVVYHPNEIPWELFGSKVRVRCVGYGCDSGNEALLVEFAEFPAELETAFRQVTVPHITLSVAQGGRSVNSGRLAFLPMLPFELDGIFGGKDEAGSLFFKTE